MFSSRIHIKNVPKYLKFIWKLFLIIFLQWCAISLSVADSVEIILLLPLCCNKWGPRIDGIRCNKKWIRWSLMPTIIVNVMKSLLLKIIISQMSYNNKIIWPIIIDMAKNLYLGEFSIYKLTLSVTSSFSVGLESDSASWATWKIGQASAIFKLSINLFLSNNITSFLIFRLLLLVKIMCILT